MKFLVAVCALVCLVQSKKIPQYLSDLQCRSSDPSYEKCVWQSFEKSRPYFIKGIPELGLPPLDPLVLPLMTVDRSINEIINIKAVLRDVNVTGMSSTIIDQVKADPIAHTGEIRVTVPWTHLEMNYEVDGQLLSIPLKSKGYFIGNFSDMQLYARGGLKLVDKDGVKFFRVDKLNSKIRVGNGDIKLIAHNPELQFGADLIADFYNENPRLVMDAVNPIFVDTATEFFRVVADQILATLPASEWLPK